MWLRVRDDAALSRPIGMDFLIDIKTAPLQVAVMSRFYSSFETIISCAFNATRLTTVQ